MSLRAKLLLVALSLLVLPATGWQFVRQMEGLVRASEAQALLASAEAVARALAQRPDALPPPGPALFVQTLALPPPLDGRAGVGWEALERPAHVLAADAEGPIVQLSLGRYADRLYLLLDVRDEDRQPADAHWPNAERRDHVRLWLQGPQGAVDLRLANAGSGPLGVVEGRGGPPPLRVDGHWRERAGGYVVELALPQGYSAGRLGLEVHDARSDGGVARHGTGPRDRGAWPVLGPRPDLVAPLGELLAPGVRARLLADGGWILAQAGDPMLPAGEAEVPWWRRQLYRWTLSAADDSFDPARDRRPRVVNPEAASALAGRPDSAWRRDASGERQWLGVAVPLRTGAAGDARGALLLERENPNVLLLADRALLRLAGLTLLAFLGSAGLIFVFAGRLGARIRRLRDAADRAMGRDGRIDAGDTAALDTRSGDEIGDLSRSFRRLLDEASGYSRYLQGLAGKLSHEINTPLAIVRGSLDNLDPEALDPESRALVERARGGVDRLGVLVRQMGESTRIERAIADADAEEVDLVALVADCAGGYRTLLSPRRLDLDLPADPVRMRASPELLAQALDKLIDNARGFCPEDGWVRIGLQPTAEGATVFVANQGPPLPAQMQGKLFDSLVSVRGERREGSHLGLGLYVVRLVAELHGGVAEARNLVDGDGVEFVLRLRGVGTTRPGRGRP